MGSRLLDSGWFMGPGKVYAEDNQALSWRSTLPPNPGGREGAGSRPSAIRGPRAGARTAAKGHPQVPPRLGSTPKLTEDSLWAKDNALTLWGSQFSEGKESVQ